MSDRLNPQEPLESEAAVEKLLADTMTRVRLDEAALDRIHQATASAWKTSLQRPSAAMPASRRRLLQRVAVAASVAALALFAVLRSSPVETASIGSLARLDAGSASAHWALWRRRAMHVGEPLRVGDTITFDGAALVALRGGGTLRVAAGTILEVANPTDLALRQGQVYVDIPPRPNAGTDLRVVTKAGSVRHLGTEFEVLITGSAVRIRVREGKVELLSAAGALTAVEGEELLAGPGGRITQSRIATFGSDWSWIVALAPEFDIEGHALMEFLQWSCRELGMHLEFADPQASRIARETILHGSIRGRRPLDALADVLASTTLTYETQAGAVRVHSAP